VNQRQNPDVFKTALFQGSQMEIRLRADGCSWRFKLLVGAVVALAGVRAASFVNSVGMTMQPIPSGEFIMGYSAPLPLPDELTDSGMTNRLFGDTNEGPWIPYSVGSGLYAASTEVTNLQFEEAFPEHRALRCKLGFSCGDNEAAVFVSYTDAVKYAEWVSAKEGKLYRLPYEAEWEYMARGGTTTYFWTGSTLPASHQNNQNQSWYPGRATPASIVVNLTVARASPNPFGLHDVHGNVEEWCADWFAPYPEITGEATPDPQPQRFRVTRGGSHSTELYFLRSAARAGALMEDASWYIGFRLVQAPSNSSLAAPQFQQVSRPRDQDHQAKPSGATATLVAVDAQGETPGEVPASGFWTPLQYVLTLFLEKLPFLHHNHDPALAVCGNGDVVATWFSTITEPGKESGIVRSRFPVGASTWERPQLHVSTPGRMDNAPNMWYVPATDAAAAAAGSRLVHVHGMSAAATWGNNALVEMTSDDCGITWSGPRIIGAEHGLRHQPVNTLVVLQDGRWALPCDNTTSGSGGTALHFSSDQGQTWTDANKSNGEYILGIHGTLLQLRNGSLLAFGRGNDINGNMAMSLSGDFGQTWSYSASPFPGIVGGQRAIVQRLSDGGILFCGFANDPMPVKTTCASQALRNVTGLFCALSDDDGATWPYRRPVSDDGPGRVLEQLDGALFVMSKTTAEGDGYTTARQGPDGTIHLISSRNHYRFTPAWARSPAAC
jgi:formylglycine-generating enzyme required for sulfatase activity